LMAI